MKEHAKTRDMSNGIKTRETASSSGTPVWCGNNSVGCCEEVRIAVFRINPNNMVCKYKKRFETSATNNLRGVETDDTVDEQIDRKLRESTHLKDVNGALTNSVTKAANERRTKKICQSASAKLPTERDTLKSHKTGLRSTASTLSQENVSVMKVSKDKTDGFSCSRVLCPNRNHREMAFIDQKQCEFKHFMHSSDHMRKYRVEYTNRKIDLLMATTMISSCSISAPSSCKYFNWLGNNMQSEGPGEETTLTTFTTTSSFVDNSNVEGIELNARKSSQGKRKNKSIIRVPGVGKQLPRLLLAQNELREEEFYTNPMVLEEKDSTESPIVCFSRPLVPRNRYDTNNPSSTDTHSCGIRLRYWMQ